MLPDSNDKLAQVDDQDDKQQQQARCHRHHRKRQTSRAARLITLKAEPDDGTPAGHLARPCCPGAALPSPNGWLPRVAAWAAPGSMVALASGEECVAPFVVGSDLSGGLESGCGGGESSRMARRQSQASALDREESNSESSCSSKNTQHLQMRATNDMNCGQQRANDNQMFWAEPAESVRLLLPLGSSGGASGSLPPSGKSSRSSWASSSSSCASEDTRKGPEEKRRRRIKLIGQQKANEGAMRTRRRLEFIRSSGGRRGPHRLLVTTAASLFALGLVVMQIITILPSCLIIYHAADCGLSATGYGLAAAGGRSLVSAFQFAEAAVATADDESGAGSPEVGQKIHVRVGILLEESNHEQANMFIRTIKMINDQKDETIRQLLNMFTAAKRAGGSLANYGQAGSQDGGGGGPGAAGGGRDQMQTTLPLWSKTNPHQRRRDEGLAARRLPRDAGQGETTFGAETGGETGPIGGGELAGESQLAGEIKSTRHSNFGGSNDGLARDEHEHGPQTEEEEQQWDGHRSEAALPNRLLQGELLREGANITTTEKTAARVNLETTNEMAPMRATGPNEFANVSTHPMPGLMKHKSHRAKWKRRAPETAAETAGGGRGTAASNGTGHASRMAKSIKTRAARSSPATAGSDGTPHGERLPMAMVVGQDLASRSQQLSFDIELEPMIEFLQDRQSALEADEKVCQLIESGVYAIFGPIDGRSIQHIQSICDNLEIPYFELRPFIGSGSSGGGGGTGGGGGSGSPIPIANSLPLAQMYVPSPAAASSLLANVTSKSASHNENHEETRRYLEANDGADQDIDDDQDQSQPNPDPEAGYDPPKPSGLGHQLGKPPLPPLGLRSDGTPAAPFDRLQASQQQQRPSPQQPQPPLANKLEALTLNLYPPSHLLNSAYIDLIYALNWTSFAIVYEDSASMIKLQSIFKESSPSNSWTNKWRIRLFRHDPDGIYGEYTEPSRGHDDANGIHRARAGGGGHQSLRAGVATSASKPIEAPPSGANSKLNNSTQGRLSFLTDNDNYNDQLRLLRDINGADIDHHGEAAFLQTDQGQPLSSASSGSASRSKSVGGTYRDVFWRVKLSGEHNILLDIKTENLYETLKQAQQVGCMTEEYSYLITSLDLHTIDLEDFKYSRTKITGFSLTQVARARAASGGGGGSTSVSEPSFDERYLENLGVYLIQQMSDSAVNSPTGQRERQHQQRNASKLRGQKQQQQAGSRDSGPRQHAFDWTNEAESNDATRREMLQSSPASLGLLPTVDRNNEQKLFDFFLEQQERNVSRVRLSTSSAIIHDSLILYMLGLNEMDPSGRFLQNDARQREPIYCSLDSQPWLHGSSLVNYMKQMTFTGLTGFVSFDQRGLRSDFKLDVLGMAPNIRLVKIGEWHSRYANDDSSSRVKFTSPGSNQLVPTGSQGARDKTSMSMSKTNTATTTGHSNGKSNANNNGNNAQGVSGGLSITTSDIDAHEDSKSYEELSSKYENELRLYEQMLARGEQVHVPYKKRVSPNGALLVNSIIFERLYREQADKIDTLIVTAKLSQPYFMLRETPNRLDGNDQFEGYAVDLIHELSKLVNFKYKWREVADKKYGSKEVLPNGTIVWNGMIGEIVRGTADLAIVDLTITAQREEAVDFTLPFMNTGISILFKKPTTKVTTLFSFLSPFSSDVWAYVLAAYCGISAILFLVGHLSPYEWADPHPCRHLNPDKDLTVLKNQFSLLNSFWFTIGSLMQQGSDLTPRSMSTRTIAGIWYFFTLIMISSYTANLAAFLTVEKVVYPIENVRDLSNQQEIKYGCVESGSTCLFFHDSKIDTYKKIDETMRLHSTYVRSNDEGQKRVGEGKFAFFMESTTIEYIIERNCNLTQIGGLLDSKGYGIALAKKSRHKRPYRTLLNEGILHLQETGMLHVLKNRWWKEKRGGGTCTDDGKGGGVTELSLANVGGVFVVLLGGLGISFLVAIAEFIWRARRGGASRDRMCEEMMNDLKFALACKSSTKPIQRVGNGNGHVGGKHNSHNNNNNNNNNGNNNNGNSMRHRLARGAEERRNLVLDGRAGGGGPNGFTSHARFHQQDSVTSSRLSKLMANVDDSTEASLRAAALADKRCNPILLHAMLTMLSAEPTQDGLANVAAAASRHGHQMGPNPQASSMAGPFSLSGAPNRPAYLNQSTGAGVRPYGLADDKFRVLAADGLAQIGGGGGGHLLSTTNGSGGPESDYVDDEDEYEDDDGELDEDEEQIIDGQEEEDEDSFSNCNEDVMERLNARRDTTQADGDGRYRLARQSLADLDDVSRRRMLHSHQTIDID